MQERIEIESRGMTLRGEIHTPEQAGKKYPAVILYHGFGGNKTGPHFLFVRLSRILESLGFVTIRFDFAGSGESDGEFIDMTLSGELEDALNILDYVKSLECVDRERIGVAGFSMGGAIASLLAGKRFGDIRALCLWAPAGNIAQIVVDDFIGKGYDEFLAKGYHEFEGLPIGRAFVDDIKNIDVYGTAAAYDKQILLLHGDMDEVVPLNASEKYTDYYGSKARLKIISGADHMFSKLAWKQQIIENTVGFFTRIT